MHPGALPLSQLVLVDIIVPPVGALLWRFMAGGWASGVVGGNAGDQVKRRQWFEFWVLLCLGYLLMFGFTVYAWLT